MNTFDRIANFLIILIVGILIGSLVTIKFNDIYEDPKVDTTVIDSLIKVNDSIKIKVEHLDSVKNAKVIEVSTLNNDSTLKLFYELVKE